MTGKTFTIQELATATEIECFICGKKAKVEPTKNNLPKGWRNANINSPNPNQFIGRFLCENEGHQVWEKIQNFEGKR